LESVPVIVIFAKGHVFANQVSAPLNGVRAPPKEVSASLNQVSASFNEDGDFD